MIPFILKGATKLPEDSPPACEHVYDTNLQLWIDTQACVPLVSAVVSRAALELKADGPYRRSARKVQAKPPFMKASPFGETVITETIEGVDQAELTAFSASPFGETLHTATVESVDNPEIAVAHQDDVDAAYSHF